MHDFAMRLYWNIGQEYKHDPGLLTLEAGVKALAVIEADTLWRDNSDQLEPAPLGYLIYDLSTRKIVHERCSNSVAPGVFQEPVSRSAPPKSRFIFWRRRDLSKSKGVGRLARV